MSDWLTIPESDPPDRRESKNDPWHMGLMITQDRAIAVATKLFPFDVADGSDCRAEHGRKGEPCNVCADRNKAWSERVREVRTAMMEAFK